MLQFCKIVERHIHIFFKEMQKLPFAVFEFNTETIRVCRSVVRRKRRVVTHCFSFPLAAARRDLPKEIRANLKNHRLGLSSAVLMLSRQQAVSYTWVLPSNDRQEISQMMRLRVLKEYLGPDKEDVVYDYKITGFDKEGCARVVVFLLRKSQVCSYFEVLSQAGIAVEGVTLNTSGLSSWLKYSGVAGKNETGRVLLLNADDRSFDLQLSSEGKTVFSRSFHIADADAAYLALSREVKLSLELCRRQQKDKADFCITGASEKLLGLGIGSWLDEEFKAFDPVEEASSYLDLKSPANGQFVSYAAVLGLALSCSYDGLDLTPPDIKREKKFLDRKAGFKRCILSCAVLFFFFCALFCVAAERKIDRLCRLKDELAASAVAGEALDSMLLRHYLEKEVSGDACMLDVAGKLFEKALPGVTFSLLSIDSSGCVFLNGVSEDIGALELFFRKLDTEDSFKDIRMDFDQVKDGQALRDVKFKISWRCHD